MNLLIWAKKRGKGKKGKKGKGKGVKSMGKGKRKITCVSKGATSGPPAPAPVANVDCNLAQEVLEHFSDFDSSYSKFRITSGQQYLQGASSTFLVRPSVDPSFSSDLIPRASGFLLGATARTFQSLTHFNSLLSPMSQKLSVSVLRSCAGAQTRGRTERH